MIPSITYISSNPNGLVSAPLGSFFYRNGQRYYIVDERLGVETQIYTVNLAVFARMIYNSDFYKNKVYDYSTQIETWRKMSNTAGDKKGWVFVSNSVPTVLEDNGSPSPTPSETPPSTPDVTPTPEPTPDVTPTPDPTPDVTPTPEPTSTPSPMPGVLTIEYMDYTSSSSYQSINCGDILHRENITDETWSASFRVTNTGYSPFNLTENFGIESIGNHGAYLRAGVDVPSQTQLNPGDFATFGFGINNYFYATVSCSLHIGNDLNGDCVVGFEAAFDTSSLLSYLLTFADTKNATIRTVSGVGAPDASRVITVAGIPRIRGQQDGTGTSSLMDNPVGARMSWGLPDGVGLFFCDGHAIRHSTIDGIVTTVAGLAGVSGFVNDLGPAARFNYPSQCYWAVDGNVYVADSLNYVIRMVNVSTTEVSTFSGQEGVYGLVDGDSSTALFRHITSISQGADGSYFVLDCGINPGEEHALRRIGLDGSVSTVRTWSALPINAVCANTDVFVQFDDGQLGRVSQDGSFDEVLPDYRGLYPVAQAINFAGVIGFRGYELNQISPNAGMPFIPQAGRTDSGHDDGEGPAASFGNSSP